jgi:prevent-host-death family protein
VSHLTINVTEFRAKCFSLLDDIAQNGGTITITKRGKPLATVGQAAKPAWKSPEGSFAGKIIITGDIVNTDTADLWDCVREAENNRR